MDKSDYEFLVGLLLAVFAFFGLDWKRVKGQFPRPTMTRKDIFFSIVIAGSLILSSVGWYQSHQPHITKFRDQKPKEVVYGRHFENEVVEMDGKLFDHCSFKNVTFYYHGLDLTGFNSPVFSGETSLRSDNQAVNEFAALAEWFRSNSVPGSVVGGSIDEHGNFIPLAPNRGPNK